jgi:hypothetical protein
MQPSIQLALAIRTVVTAKDSRFLVLPDAVDEIMSRNPGLAVSQHDLSIMVLDAAIHAGTPVGAAWDD